MARLPQGHVFDPGRDPVRRIMQSGTPTAAACRVLEELEHADPHIAAIMSRTRAIDRGEGFAAVVCALAITARNLHAAETEVQRLRHAPPPSAKRKPLGSALEAIATDGSGLVRLGSGVVRCGFCAAACARPLGKIEHAPHCPTYSGAACGYCGATAPFGAPLEHSGGCPAGRTLVVPMSPDEAEEFGRAFPEPANDDAVFAPEPAEPRPTACVCCSHRWAATMAAEACPACRVTGRMWVAHCPGQDCPELLLVALGGEPARCPTCRNTLELAAPCPIPT